MSGASDAAQNPVREKKPVRSWHVVVAVLICGLIIGYMVWSKYVGYLTVNATESVHASLVYVERNLGEIRKGDYVAFYFRRSNDLYVPQETKMLKRVACVAGERVYNKGLDYYCNDILLGKAVTEDRYGNPLKSLPVNKRIPEGYVWVMGDHTRSYDSRYWGLLSITDVLGRVHLIIKGEPLEFMVSQDVKELAARNKARAVFSQTAEMARGNRK